MNTGSQGSSQSRSQWGVMRALALLAVIALQSACTAFHPKGEAAETVAESLQTMARLEKLDQTAWKRLRRQTARAYRDHPSPPHRLRYALVLSAPMASAAELERSRELLSTLLEGPSVPPKRVRTLIQVRLAELERRQAFQKNIRHLQADLIRAKEQIRQLKEIEASTGPPSSKEGKKEGEKEKE